MNGPNPTPPQDPNQVPQYGAPQPGGPQHGGPQHGGPQYGGPPQFGGPHPGQPQPGQPQPGQPQPGPSPYGQHPPQPPQAAGFQQYMAAVSQGATVNPKLIPFLWGTVGAAAVVFLAAFLPWVSFSGGSVAGTGNGKDGWFTLILALVAGGLAAAAIFLAAQQPVLPRVAAIGTVVVGVLVTLISIVDIVDVMKADRDLGVAGDLYNLEINVGFGLWLTLLGGIALGALGVMNLINQK